MAIETLDDIVEEMADKIGVYGAHGTEDVPEATMYHCRVCFTCGLRQRIEAAANIEALMRRVQLNGLSALPTTGESK